MSDIKDYMTQTFDANFRKYKNEKLVLYGLGIHTKNILDACRGYNFYGLMDGYRKSGYMYGKKIISEEQLLKEKIQYIIIVARSNSVKIVFNRIQKFCKENEIQVFDIYGNNLMSKSKYLNKRVTFSQKGEHELKKLIDKHNVISFDIFDTIVARKVLLPHDIFILVSSKAEELNINKEAYISARIQSEQILSKYSAPTLNEIYECVCKSIKLSEFQKQELINKEIDVELNNIIPRKAIVEIFNYAIAKNKDIYFISDMYFSKEQIKVILDKCGIFGYQDIFVSSEYGVTKENGLFDIFKDKIRDCDNSYLHIGDNVEADIYSAKKRNIETFKINTTLEILEESYFDELLKHTNEFTKRYIIGRFISNIFNDPFKTTDFNGKLNLDCNYEFAFAFIAPIISTFVLWLINKLKDDGIDHILFGSRDGYLITKLYNTAIEKLKLGNMPVGNYFYTSRIAGIAASIYNKNDILSAIEATFDGTPEMLLKYRFFLEEEDIMLFGESNCSTLEEYILKHEDKIYIKSKQLRHNYIEYMKKFNLKGKVAFFDFVSSGTCQMCLEKIMKNKLVGYYFIRLNDDRDIKKMLDIHSFIESKNEILKNMKVYDNYFLFEFIISAFEASLEKFNDSGDPCFTRSKNSKEEISFIKESQEAIIDYFNELLEIEEHIKNFEEIIDVENDILKFMSSDFLNLSKIDISNITIKDEFCKREFKVKEI